MTSYVLKKKKKTLKIKEFNLNNNGYLFNPNAKAKKNYLGIKNLTIVDKTLIDNILTIKFNKKFKQLVMITFSILQTNDEETSEGDVMIALDEIQRLRAIILNKYQKFLNQKKEERFLKQLRILENELRNKQINIRMNMLNQMYYSEEENKSFGR